MLKLLGSLCIAAGGALAWYLQAAERRRERDTLSDFQTAFRRMGEEIRMARTPMPALLRALAAGRGTEAGAFFAAVSEAAARGEDLPRAWRERAEALSLNEGDKSAVSALGQDLQGDEEKVCKAISHVAYTLAKSAEQAERERPEREKRAAALWFSASALLTILLI
ncbi:stage III sporulation protein AB [uncultured Oscillibacter sp.]|uniref:stage III sporulation protein AB n=1 Tax=uncultured Oscillibacter sp. TaxID=876091 RepID=UPI0025FD337E|nr:stage III sporulation protein AB [uncultured Oscillibacter sp.]